MDGQTLNMTSGEINGAASVEAGVFKAGNGSAAAPSYTFTNDTNTGIFLSNPDNMSLQAGGGTTELLINTGGVTVSNGTFAIPGFSNVSASLAAAGGGGGTPAGSDTQVQYNDAGAFGGDADFTYDESTQTLTLDNNSTFSYLGKLKPKVTNLTNPVSGEIHPTAGSGLSTGKIYYLDGTSWTIADNTDVGDVKNLLGIAVSSTEVMIRGFYSNSGYSGLTAGEPIYLTANGDFSETIPTTISEFIRCVGYSDNASTRAIYFDPSPDYFELG